MKRKLISMLLAVLMMVGMLTVVVSAEEEPSPEICISLPGLTEKGGYVRLWCIMRLGDQAKYFVNNENGLLTAKDASADNYNVKIEYPEAGKATIYLKNAYLKNSATTVISLSRVYYPGVHDITGYPVTLVVESDSKLEAPHNDPVSSIVGYPCIGATSGPLTITGPGKLTAIAQSNHVIAHDKNPLIIKDANLDLKSEMPNSWGARHAIYGQADVVIDNSSVEMSATAGVAIALSENYDGTLVGDAWNVTIKNGSNVRAVNQYTNLATIGCTGELKIENSTVEITARARLFSPVPVLSGVNAIAGTAPVNAVAYNEKKASSYTYFKCGKDVVVPTQPTTPPETQPTTPPETQPTTPPQTQPTIPPTQATTPPQTQPTTPPTTQATTPSQTQSTTPATQATEPATEDNTTDSGNTGNALYVIAVVLGVVATAAIAVVVVVAVKMKKTEK